MTDTRDELIAALESAEGPSRVLLVKMARALNWQPETAAQIDYRKSDDEIRRLNYSSSPHARPYTLIPLWLSSIDAALTLVPDGWEWAGSLRREIFTEVIQGREIFLTRETDKRLAFGLHKEDAIAICIAALRAKKS